MVLPDRDTAMRWVGKGVVDSDGAELGACTAMLTDDATGLPKWLCVKLDEVISFVPLVDAVESADHVRVRVSRADVASAPSVGDGRHLSAEEEATLYRHYGIEYTRVSSPTQPPTGEAGPTPGLGPAADVSAASAEEAVAPTESRAAIPEPQPEPQPERELLEHRPGTLTPATHRRQILLLGALAALAAIAVAVLGARRRR
jgi:hypothetical protein